MNKYTIEQLREYLLDKKDLYEVECPICHKLRNKHGLWTHIDRSHNESKQYCQGNNGCYHKDEYKKALSNGLRKYAIKKLGEYKEFEVECYKCHKKFKVIERENKFPMKDKYFCSDFCSHSHILSNETKQKLSIQSKKYRKYPKHNICKYCGKETKNWKVKFCSNECRKQWKRRNQSEYRKYWLDCQFKFSLSEYPNEFDFTLIEKYGWYSASNYGNNLCGISRDHMLSIMDGFKNNIDSKIISHPANCKLMKHNENSSKHTKSSITLEELLKRIEDWDRKYGARDC